MFANQAKLVSTSLLVVALLMLAWTVYGTVQRALFHSRLESQPAPVQRAAAPTRAATYNVRQIVNAHLFGRAQDGASSARVTRAPETKLQLALLGVVASENPQLARAVIGVNAANAKNYSMGDKIAGTDAKLHAVEKSRVILDRNGQFESLQMVREGLDDRKRPKMPRAPITVSSSTRTEAESPPSSKQPAQPKKKFPF